MMMMILIMMNLDPGTGYELQIFGEYSPLRNIQIQPKML